MPTTGPTRLILIKAAKFSYADVDLTKPLHLVGPNNVGKTTLVNILQLLYVDKESHMSFPGYSWRDTKSYYFPDRRSYVLFECLTPEGMQVVGAYGKGPADGHDIQRFAFSGAFEKADFLTSSDEGPVPRKVEDVKQTLSLKDFRELEARTLRAALTGIGDSEGLNLGLIPVQDHNGYAKFRDLFKGLIRLRRLDQSALKETLCGTYASEMEALEINLKEAHAEEFEKMQRYRREIADLKRHEADIEDALHHANRQSELRRRSVEEWIQLLRGSSRHAASLRETQRKLQREIQQRESALQEAQKEEQALIEKRDKVNRSLGRLDGKKEELEDLIDQFSDFEPDKVASRIDELEEKRARILADLKSVDTDAPEEIQKRRDRAENAIQRLQRRLEGLQDLMGPLLQTHLGGDRLMRLFQILNPHLLELNVDGEEIVLDDLDELLRGIRAQSDRFDEGRWHFPGGHLSLAALSNLSLADYTDPDRIRNELEQRRDDYERLDRRLEIARDVSSRRREVEKIERRLKQLRSTMNTYEKAVAAEDELESVRSQIADRTDVLNTTKERLSRKEAEIQNLKRERRECRSRLEQLRAQTETIKKRMRALDVPPTAWGRYLTLIRCEHDGLQVEQSPVLLPVETQKAEEHIRSRADHYENKREQESRTSSRLQRVLDRIHSGTYGEYKKDTRTDTLDELRDQKEGLDARRRTLETLWDELMTGLGRKINDLLSSLDTIQSVVDRINRRLRGTSVSDLERLRLEITPITSFTNLLERVAKHDTMPLFGGEGTIEEDLGQLKELFQDHPQIHLTDLFNVGFAVTTAGGGTERYDGLDNIQSNGTSITIKVLVHLVLINDLLRDDALRLPFYLDEASSLDESNLEGVVRASTEMGFVPVLASPSESTAVRHIYYLQSNGERVYLGPEHRVEFREKGNASAQERGSSISSDR
jgi:hypothetical protein